MCALCLRPVIKDQHFRQVWSQHGPKSFVRRMWEIGIAIGCALEGDKEAVRVAIGYALNADIGAPFKAVDRIDLAGEGAEGVFDCFDLSGGRLFFELKEDDVTKQLVNAHGFPYKLHFRIEVDIQALTAPLGQPDRLTLHRSDLLVQRNQDRMYKKLSYIMAKCT